MDHFDKPLIVITYTRSCDLVFKFFFGSSITSVFVTNLNSKLPWVTLHKQSFGLHYNEMKNEHF
jgi:hypothetical protein